LPEGEAVPAPPAGAEAGGAEAGGAEVASVDQPERE